MCLLAHMYMLGKVNGPDLQRLALTAAITGLSFHSEGNNGSKATGPAPGEETFEEIQDRTGASETDILSKKMAFKRGMKPEKKIEEMAPMIKELRCGWGAPAPEVIETEDCQLAGF